MSVKNNLIMSVLRLTKDGPIEKHLISKYAHTPIHLVDNLLENLSDVGFIQLAGNRIEASLDQRVKIALHVMKLGADPESVCTLLQWKEFERISAIAFELNHFKVRKGLRFKSIGRRWEIDVVGCKDPLIICADCKHHHRGWTQSAVIKAAAAQGERTEALARALPV
ncbi:MAG: hypothetical protein JSV58_03000, partial [Candidatus Bathyarchaeota archaeon]